jgi:hypothetical protein
MLENSSREEESCRLRRHLCHNSRTIASLLGLQSVYVSTSWDMSSNSCFDCRRQSEEACDFRAPRQVLAFLTRLPSHHDVLS